MNVKNFVSALLMLAAAANAAPSSAGFFSPSWPTTKKLIATRFPAAKQLSTTDFAGWFADKARPEKPTVIDTRAIEEFAVSHLAGAVRAGTLREAVGVLQGRTFAAPVVVYCSVGYRSSELAVQLQKAGYTNVQNLDGSIFQWANEGRLVFKGDVAVTKVHPYNNTWGDLLEKKYWSHAP